ncbi:putative DNA helicase [Helianthus anomalus]
MRRQANETRESTAVPVTVRQLEAIVRSNVANDNDVQEAIRLFNNSTMDAAKSGLNQHINLTPEMANEIKIGWSRQAESQIKRRMAMGIGSHLSERRLIDDLTRMGLNESIGKSSYLCMLYTSPNEILRSKTLLTFLGCSITCELFALNVVSNRREFGVNNRDFNRTLIPFPII